MAQGPFGKIEAHGSAHFVGPCPGGRDRVGARVRAVARGHGRPGRGRGAVSV
ncbi:hypothetical protein GLA29479_3479 [Lysobacter antibioticus]|nr:hypothetical protein GLA29479_3479 [Lysobacter antibioticus]